MHFKTIFLIIFCILLVAGCAERKIYMPGGQTGAEGITSKQEQKAKVEETKPSEEESLSSAQMSELIKKLQEQIGDIHFDFDKYDIKQEDIPTLKQVAKTLQKYSTLKVIIEGHCDEKGTNEYNFALGQKRANAAKQYLINLGVMSSRIDIISYGEEKPLCMEHTEECWQKNRRAHFVFIEEAR